MLYRLVGDHPADDSPDAIAHLRPPGLLIRLKISCSRRDHFSPLLLIFFQRVPADINSQHLFFKCEEILPGILPHIRKLDLKFFFLVLSHHIKQCHLSRHRIFLLLVDIVHDLDIDAHELFPCAAQRVQRPGFDQVFDGALVQRLPGGHPCDKILQILEQPELLSLLHDSFDHGFPDALDRGKSVSDISSVNGEICLSLIDVRRQDPDIHLPAGVDIFCHFWRIFNHGCHKCRHEFHRIVIFQPCRLIRDHRIRRSMRLVESIFGEIDHLVIDLVRRLLIDPVLNTPRSVGLLIAVDKDLTLLLHHIRLFL